MGTTIVKSKPPQGFPSIQDMMWQILETVKASGGSASIAEIETYIIDALSLSDEVVSYAGANKINRFRTRCSWSRSFLKRYGALENASEIWSITPKGRQLTREEMVAVEREARQPSPASDSADFSSEESAITDEAWKDALLDAMQQMKPDAFERLTQKILRLSGFTDVEVTGKTGDQGIGSDKGLFITTGRFTQDARKEARRDGVIPIELIGGDELCEILKKLRLGVEVQIQQVEHSARIVGVKAVEFRATSPPPYYAFNFTN